MADEPLCQVSGCGKNEKAHLMMAHQFSPGADALARRIPVQTQRLQGIGPDPVLRILLGKKGIITAEELEATEKELRAAGLLGGTDAGYRSGGGADSSGGTEPLSTGGLRSGVRRQQSPRAGQRN